MNPDLACHAPPPSPIRCHGLLLELKAENTQLSLGMRASGVGGCNDLISSIAIDHITQVEHPSRDAQV